MKSRQGHRLTKIKLYETKKVRHVVRERGVDIVADCRKNV